MSTAREALDRIKARAEAATPGPWGCHEDEMITGHPVYRIGSDASEEDVAATHRSLDSDAGLGEAEFIAHSRSDVDRLAEALEAVLEDHQPVPYGAWASGEDMYVCSSCPDPCDAHWSAIYPCPTVSTITNALTEEDA